MCRHSEQEKNGASTREATIMPTQVLFKNEEHANYLLEIPLMGNLDIPTSI